MPGVVSRDSIPKEKNAREADGRARQAQGDAAGLPAVDVMAMIAQDLRLAQGKYALTYDALIAAMKTLLHR